MIASLVYITVKPDHIAEFIEASRINHEHSIQEEGNLRFDIIQQADDPASFVFYEVFSDEEAIAAHKRTSHYQEWRQEVEPWMASPRSGIKHMVLHPANRERW